MRPTTAIVSRGARGPPGLANSPRSGDQSPDIQKAGYEPGLLLNSRHDTSRLQTRVSRRPTHLGGYSMLFFARMRQYPTSVQAIWVVAS